MNEINTLAVCNADENGHGKDKNRIHTHKWLLKINNAGTITEGVQNG